MVKNESSEPEILGRSVVAGVAGLTIPLVDPTYTPDAAAAAVTDCANETSANLLKSFPYLGLPGGGYETKPGKTDAS